MTTIKNVSELETAIIEMAKEKSFIAKKEALMNSKINKLKELFESETKESNANYSDLYSSAEAFCIKNKLMFQKQRTIELTAGKVGFRINPPKVVMLNRKYNLKTVLELVKKIFTGLYIRSKEELDKESILTDYSQKKLTDDTLAGIGLRVEQDETFFIDIDYTKLLKN